MINLLFCCVLFSLDIAPQNVLWDHYTIIPPLGEVKSIAASPLSLLVISDNNLLIFEKYSLKLKKTLHFNDQNIYLLAYDRYSNEFWILGEKSIIRLTMPTYTLREYPVPEQAERLGVSRNYLYLDGVKNFSFDKRNGVTKLIQVFPEGIEWYKKTGDADIKKYPYLTPYYYFDEAKETQTPFARFRITALYDDGMDIYVGTRGYGILKYNKISWQKKRIIYGPLDLHIRQVKKFDDKVYFVSHLGLSFFTAGTDEWHYHRFVRGINNILLSNKELIITLGGEISRIDKGMTFTISTLTTDVLCLSADETSFYIGTSTGLYKLYKGTNDPMQFGPEGHAIYCVLPADGQIYAGGEFGFYRYDRDKKKWNKELNFGVKEIVQIKDVLYLLSTNNQLIKYRQGEDTDTNWVLLPYFNIYDIDSDDEVLYCATFAGIYYYEPDTELYKVIYNLPRIKYDYVFVTGENIISVSNSAIYSLPIEHRD